jgi:diguanylate cyclase (GGDEF)-like protein
LGPLYIWIPVIYVFAFTLSDHRSSMKLSLGILAVFVAASLPYILHSPPRPDTNFTVQLHMVSAILIAALYCFSSYQHRFQIAQLTADELARMANTDELTGLANRRRMAEVIESELLRFARYGNAWSAILIDVDHFKSINDRFGHTGGDQALMALARRCKEKLRDVDVIGRWGGDEFVVLLPETPYEDCLSVADALCRHIEADPLSDGHRITISCGVTSASPGDDLGSLLHRADLALYACKDSGRNCAYGIRAGLTREGTYA